jgi:hypothetical protein
MHRLLVRPICSEPRIPFAPWIDPLVVSSPTMTAFGASQRGVVSVSAYHAPARRNFAAPQFLHQILGRRPIPNRPNIRRAGFRALRSLGFRSFHDDQPYRRASVSSNWRCYSKAIFADRSNSLHQPHNWLICMWWLSKEPILNGLPGVNDTKETGGSNPLRSTNEALRTASGRHLYRTMFAVATNLFQCDEKLDF